MATRIERDPLGELRVPADAYYGVQTQRAVENFPISGLTAPPPLVTATVLVKQACARANGALGRLDAARVHPNDHVNMGQSTNDVFPTATRLAILLVLPELHAGVTRLADALDGKARD